MTNVDPDAAHAVAIDLRGVTASAATGRVLTAPATNSYNSFEHPDVVKPVPFTGARIAGGRLSVTLPARSVVVLELR
jgi:alpha-L-arabinofuranosidase